MIEDKRRHIARQIVENPDMLEFLTEMFVPDYTSLHKDAEKNILALDDEQYGRAMKLFYIKREENERTLAEIALLGRQAKGTARPVAPS